MKTILAVLLVATTVAFADSLPSRSQYIVPNKSLTGEVLKVVPKNERAFASMPSRTTRDDLGVQLNGVSYDGERVHFTVSIPPSKGKWKYRIYGFSEDGKTNVTHTCSVDGTARQRTVSEEKFKAVTEWVVISSFARATSISWKFEPEVTYSVPYVYLKK